MSRTAAMIYIMWSMFLIGMAIYILGKMNDTSNPNSLRSSFQKIEESMTNENP